MGHNPTRRRERRATPRFAHEIEVTVQSEQGLIRGVTRDVGAGGLFVKTPETPDPGTEVRTVVGGWGEAAPITFGGQIRHILPASAASPERPAGMGIAITDVDDAMQMRWIRLVAGVAHAIDDRLRDTHQRSDGSDPAQLARRHARHRVQLAVRVHEISESFDLVTRNASAGGLFVECEAPPLQAGRAVTVGIRNRVTLVTLTLPGRVVRASHDGLGIEFEIPEAAREELRGFLISGTPVRA